MNRKLTAACSLSSMFTASAVLAQSGLESRVRQVPVEIVVSGASGQLSLVTRAIDETPFVELRPFLPDAIPVRTVGADGSSTLGVEYRNTAGSRQVSPPGVLPSNGCAWARRDMDDRHDVLGNGLRGWAGGRSVSAHPRVGRRPAHGCSRAHAPVHGASCGRGHGAQPHVRYRLQPRWRAEHCQRIGCSRLDGARDRTV